MEELQFDRAGVFTYSREEGTPMAEMVDQVPARVARQRLAAAMKLQQAISRRRNAALVGTNLDVLVEGVESPVRARALPLAAAPGVHALPLVVGRSYRDAPEVDGLVFMRGVAARIGDVLRTRVTAALDYDLVAEPVQP